VLDFSRYPAGTELFLTDFLRQKSGRGPGGTVERPDQVSARLANRILKFVVDGGPMADQSQVPDQLRPFQPVPQAKLDAAERRTFKFQRKHGAWTINDQFFNAEKALITVARGRPQIWTLKNGGGGWWHPVHIHISNMRVLERNGRQPGPLERDGMAKENTVQLGPNDEVKIFIEFLDFTGLVVFHCHNLQHEDHFMMGRMDIVE
jgi:FtsP/CotA-like multicopper oxidase with cupredoxin domain